MAAISSVLLQLCSTGDHIVCSNTVYGAPAFKLLWTGCWLSTTLLRVWTRMLLKQLSP